MSGVVFNFVSEADWITKVWVFEMKLYVVN